MTLLKKKYKVSIQYPTTVYEQYRVEYGELACLSECLCTLKVNTAVN